jgi:hypothetical protein
MQTKNERPTKAVWCWTVNLVNRGAPRTGYRLPQIPRNGTQGVRNAVLWSAQEIHIGSNSPRAITRPAGHPHAL